MLRLGDGGGRPGGQHCLRVENELKWILERVDGSLEVLQKKD